MEENTNLEAQIEPIQPKENITDSNIERSTEPAGSVFDVSEVPQNTTEGIDPSLSPRQARKIIKQRKKAEKKAKFKKRLKGTFIGIVVFLILFFIGVNVFFRARVSDYYKYSERSFRIPDISKGYIPQGLDYDDLSGDFYLTGYMGDGSASPIYIVNKETGKLERKVLMANPSGSDFTEHAGGLKLYQGKLYVAGGTDNCLYVFNPSEIREAKNGDSVAYSDTVALAKAGDDIRVSFVGNDDHYIYAGEFYKKDSYPTNDMHVIPTSNGENRALIVGMTLDGNVATPQVVYSIPNEIQGMAFNDGCLYLTRSWAVSFSDLYVYDLSTIKQSGTHKVLGKDTPLYILDETVEKAHLKMAPMAEEIDFAGGKMYTSCESASDKYIFGKLYFAKKIVATDVNEMINALSN